MYKKGGGYAAGGEYWERWRPAGPICDSKGAWPEQTQCVEWLMPSIFAA